VREHELEAVLSRHLGRVAAPEGWRVGFSPRGASAPPPSEAEASRGLKPTLRGAGWWAVAVAAVAVILLVWVRHEPSEFRSGDPVEIRGWLRARTGFDIPLRADPPGSIRLVGAHASASAAEVDYQIDGRDASLTVAAAPPGARPNGPRHSAGARVSSWVAGGQLYTLACARPEDSQLACLLCHAEVN
jgi:hypothetical protein